MLSIYNNGFSNARPGRRNFGYASAQVWVLFIVIIAVIALTAPLLLRSGPTVTTSPDVTTASEPAPSPRPPAATRTPRPPRKAVRTASWYVDRAVHLLGDGACPLLWMLTIALKGQTRGVRGTAAAAAERVQLRATSSTDPKAIHFPRLLLNSVVITGQRCSAA